MAARYFFFANLEQCLLAGGFALGAKLRDFGGRQGVGSQWQDWLEPFHSGILGVKITTGKLGLVRCANSG